MKTKLLRKSRAKIKFFERNGNYYVDLGSFTTGFGKDYPRALEYYRLCVIRQAEDLFGFKPKKQLWK